MESVAEIVTVVGIVVPVDWDDKGKPRAHAISTYEEQEFLIDAQSVAGKALTGMPQQKIRVKGILGASLHNRRIIRVIQYERI